MHLWRIPYSTHGGLVARAAPGTHEAVAEEITRLSLDANSAVMDLAAGTGALLSRIKSMGFRDLDAIELDKENFGIPSIAPRSLDLNEPFAQQVGKLFDLVTAIEIIEHLDHPRLFLGQIRELLKPGGYAIVSTPNVAHWLGRLQFLFKGTMKYFTEQDFHDQRHISPILDMHMRIMVRELGFELVQMRTTATSWGLLIRILTFPFSVWFRLTNSGDTDGNVNLYVIRKVH